jgi:hypothetical protein
MKLIFIRLSSRKGVENMNKSFIWTGWVQDECEKQKSYWVENARFTFNSPIEKAENVDSFYGWYATALDDMNIEFDIYFDLPKKYELSKVLDNLIAFKKEMELRSDNIGKRNQDVLDWLVKEGVDPNYWKTVEDTMEPSVEEISLIVRHYERR